MTPRFASAALTTAALAGACLSATAQTVSAPVSVLAGDQLEADYRVIAARCGTPAFEKAFYFQSRAAVSAGLVAKGRDPTEVEKTVTALRRSPFVLVAAPGDCAAQMVLLKDLQKRRGETLRGSKPRKTTAS